MFKRRDFVIMSFVRDPSDSGLRSDAASRRLFLGFLGAGGLEFGAPARPLHDARGDHLQASARSLENGCGLVREEAVGTAAVGGERHASGQLVHALAEHLDGHVDGVGKVSRRKFLRGANVEQDELAFGGVVDGVLDAERGVGNAAFGLKTGQFGDALLGRLADHDGKRRHLGARKPIALEAAVAGAGHEPRAIEDAKVRADALVVLVEHLGKLFDGLRTLGEELDELEPDFMTEGLADQADLLVEAVLAFEVAQGVSPFVLVSFRSSRGVVGRAGLFENMRHFTAKCADVRIFSRTTRLKTKKPGGLSASGHEVSIPS